MRRFAPRERSSSATTAWPGSQAYTRFVQLPSLSIILPPVAASTFTVEPSRAAMSSATVSAASEAPEPSMPTTIRLGCQRWPGCIRGQQHRHGRCAAPAWVAASSGSPRRSSALPPRATTAVRSALTPRASDCARGTPSPITRLPSARRRPRATARLPCPALKPDGVGRLALPSNAPPQEDLHAPGGGGSCYRLTCTISSVRCGWAPVTWTLPRATTPRAS